MEKLAINGGSPVRTKAWTQWPVFDESDVQAVADVVRSGKWGTGGENVPRFERTFADYCGSKYGVCLNSGTSALYVALLAAGIGPGDEVIVPDYTFVATASAVLSAGAVPVLADIEPDTYNLSPQATEAAITPRTKAIIPVHFAGGRADMNAFVQLGKRYGLVIIEDAAHAHGAHYAGSSTGFNLAGTCACFSFQASKNLNSGEGGFILTDDEAFYRRCRSITNCGRATVDSVWYGHHLPGGNFRLSEMQAALLLAQFRRLEDQAARRDENGLYLDSRLAEIDGIQPCGRNDQTLRHAYHLYMMRYDAAAFGGTQRDEFLKMMRAEGIPCSPGYPVPLHHQPLFSGENVVDDLPRLSSHRAQVDYSAVSNPVTERACAGEAIWLEQKILLGDTSDMDDIIAAIKKIKQAVSAGVAV